MSGHESALRKIVQAAKNRTTGNVAPWTFAYITQGGTWILASEGAYSDSGQPRDLLAVLPHQIEDSRVQPLYIAANPEVIEAIRNELD